MTDMTHEAAEIAKLAGKLTPAQRAIVMGECRPIGNPAVQVLMWGDWNDRRNARTFDALTKHGIIFRSRFGPTSLTAEGIAVRAILSEKGEQK